MAETEDKKRDSLWNGEQQESNAQTYTLDTLLRDLGGCGRFQVIFVVLEYCLYLPVTCSLMFMIFGIYNPGLECGGDLLVNNWTLDEYNTRLTPGQDEDKLSENRTWLCTCDTIKSHQNWTFRNTASTVVTEWSLVCDDAWKASSIISVQMVGVLLGSFIGGQIGDKFGRKFSVYGGTAVLAVANFIAIFSVSWLMYAGVRFFIGLSVGCILSSLTVYYVEFVPAWWRAFLPTFPFWSLSTISLALVVMALKDWRNVHIAISVVSVLMFLPVFWLPESVRFLTVHGHLTRAGQVVEKIAKLNRKPLPDTTIMEKIAEVEKESLKDRSSYTYLDLFHISIRKYTIVLAVTWFVIAVSNNFISFGLTSFSGDFYINMLIFLSLPFPSRLIVVVIAMKVGRKTAVVCCLCLACLCSCLVVGVQLLAQAGARGTVTTALACLANMALEAGWGVVVVMTVELFPTGVRNMAYAFFSGLARIGSIISPYLIPKQSLPMWAVFLLIGILLLISFVSILTLPESSKRPLFENLKQANNKRKLPTRIV